MIEKQKANQNYNIITAGAAYIDIDAYACSIAMAELLCLKGEHAIAYSNASRNYSVCKFLVDCGQMLTTLPDYYVYDNSKFIIVDVSDPNFLAESISLDNVIAVYDHHVGYEEYWRGRIGDNANIEFIGAAATLIYREWKKFGMTDKMKKGTAKLLIAAILDNTLNLTSAVTTKEDIDTFNELCKFADIHSEWCVAYFSAVQESIEADLKNALFGDVKNIRGNSVLPSHMGQIAIWNVEVILDRLSDIRNWFNSRFDWWMLNIIDIQHKCSYFVCDSMKHQEKIESTFDVHFESGIAKTSVSYLRKELIKRTLF